ncbi:MAG: hypothetical protein COB29_01195, partial [Sulfitobacter sp.]
MTTIDLQPDTVLWTTYHNDNAVMRQRNYQRDYSAVFRSLHPEAKSQILQATSKSTKEYYATLGSSQTKYVMDAQLYFSSSYLEFVASKVEACPLKGRKTCIHKYLNPVSSIKQGIELANTNDFAEALAEHHAMLNDVYTGQTANESANSRVAKLAQSLAEDDSPPARYLDPRLIDQDAMMNACNNAPLDKAGKRLAKILCLIATRRIHGLIYAPRWSELAALKLNLSPGGNSIIRFPHGGTEILITKRKNDMGPCGALSIRLTGHVSDLVDEIFTEEVSESTGRGLFDDDQETAEARVAELWLCVMKQIHINLAIPDYRPGDCGIHALRHLAAIDSYCHTASETEELHKNLYRVYNHSRHHHEETYCANVTKEDFRRVRDVLYPAVQEDTQSQIVNYQLQQVADTKQDFRRVRAVLQPVVQEDTQSQIVDYQLQQVTDIKERENLTEVLTTLRNKADTRKRKIDEINDDDIPPTAVSVMGQFEAKLEIRTIGEKSIDRITLCRFNPIFMRANEKDVAASAEELNQIAHWSPTITFRDEHGTHEQTFNARTIRGFTAQDLFECIAVFTRITRQKPVNVEAMCGI